MSNRLSLIIISIIIVVIGCRSNKFEDVSNKKPYTEYLHREFLLKKNCYIFKPITIDPKNPYFSYKFIEVCNKENSEFPAIEYNPELIGKIINGYKIIDFIPKGTLFELTKVMQETLYVNHCTNRSDIYIIKISSYDLVVAYRLMYRAGKSDKDLLMFDYRYVDYLCESGSGHSE